MRLQEHRESLRNNPRRFEEYKEQAIVRMIVVIDNRIEKPDRTTLAHLIWTSQGGVPLFSFEDSHGMPMAWNAPGKWKLPYIKYEIGHMIPKNQGGSDLPSNLCFMSARCNQHIQSSLDLDIVLECYFKANAAAKAVNDRVQALRSIIKDNQTWLDISKKYEFEL